MPLSAILAEFARPGGQTTVVDFRAGVPGLMVTALQLVGRGVRYEPILPVISCRCGGAQDGPCGPNTMPGATTG